MQTLSYRVIEDEWIPFFELLVDGKPLGALVGSRDTAFPFRDVDDGLPRYPSYGREPDDPEYRIVCVCGGCGEYGCSHTGCRVTRVGDEIIFNEFDFDVSPEGAQKLFRFDVANYEAVCKDIADLARQQRERDAATRR